MKAPQLIVIAFMCFSLGIRLAEATSEDGKPSVFFTSLIAWCIWVAILAWGGFWK